MNFKKKFDYDDINIFLPDNKTIATTDYFKNKYKGMPDYICEMLEVKSRVEYNEKSELEFINMIKEKKRLEDEKLIKEFDDRQNESITFTTRKRVEDSFVSEDCAQGSSSPLTMTPLKNVLDELDELDLNGVTILEPAK